MNQEDIERMVEEAENWTVNELQCVGEYHPDFHTVRDQRFAALVATAERDKYEAKFKQLEAIMQEREQQPNKPCCLAEREACAKVCEDNADDLSEGDWDSACINCAATIRARSNP